MQFKLATKTDPNSGLSINAAAACFNEFNFNVDGIGAVTVDQNTQRVIYTASNPSLEEESEKIEMEHLDPITEDTLDQDY